MKTAKKAGSIVMSFSTKDPADRVLYSGIFLNYNENVSRWDTLENGVETPQDVDNVVVHT